MSPPISATRGAPLEPYGPACDDAPGAAPTPAAAPNWDAVHAAHTRAPNLRGMQLVQPLPTKAAIEPLALRPVTSAVTATLDAIEKAFAGPYRVAGRDQPIFARATFHSAHEANKQLKDDKASKALAERACTTPALQKALRACQEARPTPAQLVMVTQALLDAGALAGVSPVGGQHIRDLQRRFCIGVDCIGYVMLCQRALHGAQADQGRDHQTLAGQLATNPTYAKVPNGLHGVMYARPGDVLHLDRQGTADGREHNVVIRQHDVVRPNDSRWPSLLQSAPQLVGSGQVHLLDVVQSGGGPDDVRGVRHQTWLYAEPSGTWGVLDPTTKDITFFEKGPQEHPVGTLFTTRKAS